MKKKTNEGLTRAQLQEERRYGAFWYSWLWTVLRPVLMGLCVLLVVIGIVMGVVNKIRSTYFDAVDINDTAPVTFVVESGSSLTRVANRLESEGLIRSGTLFRYYGDLQGYGQKIQTGTYMLSKSMSMSEIMDVLTTGDGNPITRDITVIPGWTVRDMAENLFTDDAKRGEFLQICTTGRDSKGTDFTMYYYIADAAAAPGAKNRPFLLEGYLAADTYEVYTDASVTDIIRKLLAQTQVVFPQEYQDRADEIGMSMDEVFIMASIVEKEAKTDDFGRVAAVFHNRLHTALAGKYHKKLSEVDGTLGSDATIKYATGITRMSLTKADTSVSSPYNTYTNKGLPSGPVCSPSKAAIRAVLYPDEEFLRDGYLYFCSMEPDSGRLIFARNYAEHQRNVAVYSPLWEAYDREHGN
ncbi:MAG: endolytic transglycosylase MltG [Clostridiales bacterium]|nr:endolytic transglycosylase MltG [Clostridiales bacterium]